MELALDPGDQDLLGFLLEESGDLWAAPDEALEAPLDWELSPSEVGGLLGGGGRGRGTESSRQPRGRRGGGKSRSVDLLELCAGSE
jgi:hypothetical protein